MTHAYVMVYLEAEDNVLSSCLHVFLLKQERAAGALANLAADDKCSLEVAVAGGVQALVMLARLCKIEGVQEQVSLTLSLFLSLSGPLYPYFFNKQSYTASLRLVST